MLKRNGFNGNEQEWLNALKGKPVKPIKHIEQLSLNISI